MDQLGRGQAGQEKYCHVILKAVLLVWFGSVVGLWVQLYSFWLIGTELILAVCSLRKQM